MQVQGGVREAPLTVEVQSPAPAPVWRKPQIAGVNAYPSKSSPGILCHPAGAEAISLSNVCVVYLPGPQALRACLGCESDCCRCCSSFVQAWVSTGCPEQNPCGEGWTTDWLFSQTL